MHEVSAAPEGPNAPVIEALRAEHAAGRLVVFMTGRTSGCRDATLAWLERHAGVPVAALRMRAPGDFRKDPVVKRELFDAHVRARFDVRRVYDDRDTVVAMWRSLGLPCLQVADGDF